MNKMMLAAVAASVELAALAGANWPGFERGMGIGGWLTNYKRFNVLPVERRFPITIGDMEHFDTYITEKDVANIARMGFDHIRVGFDQVVLESADGVWRERPFARLQDFVGWCDRHHLNVVLNLHKAIGNYCDIPEKVSLLDDAALQERFIRLWLEIERRFANKPGVAFELLNEVRDVKPEKWNSLADRTLKQIRKVNPNRWVVIGSTCWNSPDTLKRLQLWDDPKVVYTFHFYSPFEFTHQRGVLQAGPLYYNRELEYPSDDVERYRGYNGGYGGTKAIDRNHLRQLLGGAIDFAKRHPDKILWNGEFGTIRHAPPASRVAYMRDVVAICKEAGIPWCVWNYLSTPNDGNRFSLVDDDTRQILSADLLRACLGEEAEWISSVFSEPSAQPVKLGKRIKEKLPKDCTRFRKVFFLPAGRIREAKVNAVGLGGYELWVNGKKADDERTGSPAWSDPAERILFDTYDVTACLKSGEDNALGMWLSPGYSDDFFCWGWRWLRPQSMWLELNVTYEDGRMFFVKTDSSWQWTAEQPITYASIYHGETYDATKDDPCWAKANGSKSNWQTAVKVVPPVGRLMPNPGAVVRYRDPLLPVKISQTATNTWLFDFGVNCAGVVGFNCSLKHGARVTIRNAEAAKNGHLDSSGHGNAKQCDTFIAAGNGNETYRPRFTFHSLRFAEISGIDEQTAKTVRAWAVGADLRQTATFRSSDETLNWLWDASLRTQRGNFQSYPSDCFSRGERTPCLMDSTVYEDVAVRAFDMRDYYSKWLFDTVRYEFGVDPKASNNDNPDWAGEPIMLAERLVKRYGILPEVRREYSHLKEIADGFLRRATNGVWRMGFGDWCSPNLKGSYQHSFSAVAIVNSALLCDEIRAMSELAAGVGTDAEAQYYKKEYARLKATFLKEFYHPDTHTFGDGKQTELILPLALNLVPEQDRPAVLAALKHRIEGVDKGRIGTGIYGTRYLGDVLLDNGFGGLWLKMIQGPEWPSFGYNRLQGATTMWEQWVKDGGMASHCHSMFTGAISCFLTHLAGIRTVDDSSCEFEIRPCFPEGLEWISASQDFAMGKVEVEWHQKGGRTGGKVRLPRGAKGVLVVQGRRIPLNGSGNWEQF